MVETHHVQKFAFFDVDGTVIARDSFRILMRELIIKRSRLRLMIASILFLLLVVLRTFGLVGKTQFKSALLWSATIGLNPRESLRRIRSVIQEHVQPLWFAEMTSELERLRAQGMQVCYVSASGEFWLRVLLGAMDRGPKIIVGSKLQRFCGGITLKGPNCLGREKIRRLRGVIPENAIWCVAYSDHRADLPLLLASRERVVVNPTPKNLRVFRKTIGEDHFKLVHWTPVHLFAGSQR